MKTKHLQLKQFLLVLRVTIQYCFKHHAFVRLKTTWFYEISIFISIELHTLYCVYWNTQQSMWYQIMALIFSCCHAFFCNNSISLFRFVIMTHRIENLWNQSIVTRVDAVIGGLKCWVIILLINLMIRSSICTNFSKNGLLELKIIN